MFDTSLFASPVTLLFGAITGLVFGFLLQKGGVTRHKVIVGQFLLRDHTVLKVMGMAIVVGGFGVWAMWQFGWIGLHVKSTHLLANALGGLVFGSGMAILGLCPGTAVAALGDGSRDAISGVVGMLFGAAVFAEVYPWLRAEVLPMADLGKETLATATGLSPWWFMVLLAFVALLGFRRLDRAGTSGTGH